MTDTSFPFLAIARRHGVPYAEVLRLAEQNVWWEINSNLQFDVQKAVEQEALRRERVIAES